MESPTARSTPPPRKNIALLLRRGVSVVLIAGAIVLGIRTTVAALQPASVQPPVPVLPSVADPVEADARQREISGTYATGSQSGDRVIVIHGDGRIDFSELGANATVNSDSDVYQLRRSDKKFALVTSHSGVIDVVDTERVSYWRDMYRRR